MTGYECLLEKMKEKGCTDAQLKTKVVSIVLGICSDNDADDVIAYYDYKKEVNELKADCAFLDMTKKQLKRQVEALRNEFFELQEIKSVKEIENNTENICNETKSKIDEFYETLNNCETAEGRDAIKKAQLFLQLAKDETRTAVINGLSAMLSSRDFPGIDSIGKIDTTVPSSKKIRR